MGAELFGSAELFPPKVRLGLLLARALTWEVTMSDFTDPRGSDVLTRSSVSPDRLIGTTGSARISACEKYRYSLDRGWATNGGIVVWIMLNPSKADAITTDNTVQRIIDYSQRWGFASLRVVNLYAYRSTDPDALLSLQDPIGPDNDAEIEYACEIAARIVCAWGAHSSTQRLFGSGCRISRESQVRAIISRSGKPCGVLSLTKSGSPRHPLRIPAATPWSVWQP